ncbi:DNA mismatch repair protein msh3 [Plakobranchus ocellatus]|uniref:DNA mismatch repair protein MSH3 n=1 Tax=Plakobranchus ocellatus TaxID=259542 RepID=A0AAV4B4J9_9GAST|nr:DNA mismatch repair protein msh3 [Plakobranchus ocellatus]
MPPKNKSKSAHVQTTLSKFFAQSSTSSSKRNLAAHRTDEKDDFEVILAKAAKKRLKPKVDEEFGPKNKKVCLQDELVEKVEIENHPALDIASQSSSQELQNTASKLKQFELYEEKDVDVVKHIFQSKNCPMIPFIDGQKEDESNQKLVSEENEDEENLSSQAPSLSAFAAPGKVREGQCKANVFNKTLSNGNLKTKKYTPLEQQVVDIKTQRPDALLCIECGYKYRFFGEDAEIAAKVLKIYCHLDHNFMTASIPTHRLFVHVRRLVAAGYKVGVVKQTETAHLKAASDNKTGPFTRRLTALYTKSTLIVKVCNEEDGISTDRDTALRRNQHLLCIYEQPSGSTPATHHVGIVCVDPATGDVLYDDFHDSSTCTKLETRISHLRPVEIVTSSDVSEQMKNFIMKLTSLSLTDDDKIRVETVPEKHFSDYAATVKEFYEDAKDLSFVHNLPKPTLSCLAALCVYLRDFQLESILKLAQSFSRFSEQSRFMYLSSQCLHNLEVFQNSCDGSEKGSLFWILDNTRTKFGSRLLRKWLNQPLLNHKEILERQSAVEELVENGCAGIKSLADLMNKLPDLERGLCSIFYQRCSPLEFYNVAHFLVKVHKAVQGLSTAVYSKPLQLLLNEIFDCLDGVGVYIKSINEKAARDNDMPSLFVDGLEDESVSSVYATKENINDILREIQDHRKEVRIALRQPGLNYTTVLQTEFLIEVKNTQLKSVPSDWTQISSTKIVSRFHTPFLVEKYRKLNQLREQLQEDAKAAWQIFLKHFSSNFVTYKKAVTHLATVDCLMSLANVASQGSFCKPHLDSERVHIEIIQGRHPIIEALSNGQDQYVPNDTNLSVS